MRTIWLALAAILVTASLQGACAQGSFEPNVDRQGSDYHNFDIQGGAAACQSACAGDRQCVAWTFVHRNVQAASQRCWLKNNVPPPAGDSCCVSGVMRAPAAAAAAGGQAVAGGGQRYNPAWQAAPGDSSCCPNNMLVCPVGRHFCTAPAANAAATARQTYNPAWQAAPGDSSCCPNNMLVCPTPRHFCKR